MTKIIQQDTLNYEVSMKYAFSFILNKIYMHTEKVLKISSVIFSAKNIVILHFHNSEALL